METYRLTNSEPWGFKRTITWEGDYNDETTITVTKTKDYRHITFNITMTPEQKAELEAKEIITMEDISEYSYSLDPSEYDWDADSDSSETMNIGGDISIETQMDIMRRLAENDDNPSRLWWGVESSTGYVLVRGGLEFTD